jgi:hypothetical protein
MSSVSPDNGAPRTRYAITDVYDERRRTFLVQYPIWVVVLLGLAGVLAFALIGFLGYKDGFKDDSPDVYFVFKEAWPLFLWFCALIMALEISILRNPKLRGQLTAVLLATLISMVIVGIIYFYKVNFLQLLQDFLKQVLNIRFLINFQGSKFLYALINFAMIGIFWADTIRRWIRSSQGKPINSRVDIGLGGTKTTPGPTDKPTFQELVSGDLIAGAALAALLALVFRSDLLSAFSNLLGIGVPVTDCITVWPFGACTPPGGGLANPPTLTFIDTIQALIYLPLGLLILALSAMLSGFGAVGGVDEQALGQNELQPTNTDESSTESVSEQVSMTVINTLRSALNRRLRLALDNMLYSLRNAVWPALILVGVIAVASSAKFTRLYLHLQSDANTCNVACKATLDFYGWPYQYVIYAGLFGILAVVTIVLAVTLLVFRLRVAENTFRFLGLIGFIILLTFWIFSLALSGFNGLLKLTGATEREPFPPFGAATVISLAALIIWAAIVLVRRMRGSSVSGG